MDDIKFQPPTSISMSRRVMDISEVRKAFTAIDEKQDGAIDKRELIKALRKHGWIGDMLGFK